MIPYGFGIFAPVPAAQLQRVESELRALADLEVVIAAVGERTIYGIVETDGDAVALLHEAAASAGVRRLSVGVDRIDDPPSTVAGRLDAARTTLLDLPGTVTHLEATLDGDRLQTFNITLDEPAVSISLRLAGAVVNVGSSLSWTTEVTVLGNEAVSTGRDVDAGDVWSALSVARAAEPVLNLARTAEGARALAAAATLAGARVWITAR